MKTLLLIAAVTLTAGAAHAQSWSPIVSQNGQKLEFDAASVVDEAGIITFTTRTTFEQPTAETSTDGQSLEGVSVAQEIVAVDCNSRTYTEQGVRYSNAEGGLIAGNRAASPATPIGSDNQSLVGGFIATLCPA